MHFPVGMLNRGYEGICVYGVGAWHISNVSNDAQNAFEMLLCHIHCCKGC